MIHYEVPWKFLSLHNFLFFSFLSFFLRHNKHKRLLEKLKRIEYLVARKRTDTLISTAVAPAPRDCGPRNQRLPGRWAPSTAQQCALARRRCDRMDPARAASQKPKISVLYSEKRRQKQKLSGLTENHVCIWRRFSHMCVVLAFTFTLTALTSLSSYHT